VSFEGLPVQLKGIEVRVTYTDGTSEVIRDHTRFYTMPNAFADPGMLTAEEDIGVGDKLLRSYNGDGEPVRAEIGNVTVMPIPYDYLVAEYRVLDYVLAYNPNGREAKFARLRIKGVLDLEAINFMDGLPKKEYYIDDVIDLSGVRIELVYNTAKGLFLLPNGMDVAAGDDNGTPFPVVVPFNQTWDWSLNPPRSKTGKPVIQVNFGDRLVKTPADLAQANGTSDVAMGDRLGRQVERFDRLYMVEDLVIMQKPEVGDGIFYSDYEPEETNMRNEWLHTALKDVVVEVRYKAADGTVPPPKRIVVDPKGSLDLPMDRHLVWAPPLFGPNPEDVRGPMEGDTEAPTSPNIIAYNTALGVNGYSEYYSCFVFKHENAELLDEFNVDQSKAKWAYSDPVKVYVLGDEDGELEGAITVTYDESAGEFYTQPAHIRGDDKQFLERLTITATYTYVDPATGDSDVRQEPIDPDNPRVRLYWDEVADGNLHERHIVLNNGVRQGGTGIYHPDTWTVQTERAILVTYEDTGRRMATAEEAIELVITDPNL